MIEPALALIEYKSVARGILSCDAMVKKAPVRILQTHPVCPGKYMTIVAGEVADVEEALRAGLDSGGDMVVAELFLPYIHRDVIPALAGAVPIERYGALGVVETFSVAVCLHAADIAVKKAAVRLLEIRLANGLGGKGYFVMTGELTDIEAALDAAVGFSRDQGQLAGQALIPAPHADLLDRGMYW